MNGRRSRRPVSKRDEEILRYKEYLDTDPPGKKSRNQKRRARKTGRKHSNRLVWLQAVSTGLFLMSLFFLDLLPIEYVLLILAALLLLLLLGISWNIRARRRPGGLRVVFCAGLSALLLLGSWFSLRAGLAVNSVAAGHIQSYYSETMASRVDEMSAAADVRTAPFAVYISGIDVYGELETSSRSDVNIVALVHPGSHQILLITTPRDCYIELPGASEGERDKLTHAGIYGVDVSMAALEELYDIEIPFYARVNFTSFIEIIDALGGVDVDSDYAFTTSQDSGLVMDVSEGRNHFNGEQALAFSRERQNLPDGDNQRGRNQQAVITAILRKAVSPQMLLAANSLFSGIPGNVETNMDRHQLRQAVKGQLAPGAGWDIKSVSLEGIPGEEYCYSYSGGPLYVAWPDEDSLAGIQEEIQALLDGEKLDS